MRLAQNMYFTAWNVDCPGKVMSYGMDAPKPPSDGLP